MDSFLPREGGSLGVTITRATLSVRASFHFVTCVILCALDLTGAPVSQSSPIGRLLTRQKLPEACLGEACFAGRGLLDFDSAGGLLKGVEHGLLQAWARCRCRLGPPRHRRACRLSRRFDADRDACRRFRARAPGGVLSSRPAHPVLLLLSEELLVVLPALHHVL